MGAEVGVRGPRTCILRTWAKCSPLHALAKRRGERGKYYHMLTVEATPLSAPNEECGVYPMSTVM